MHSSCCNHGSDFFNMQLKIRNSSMIGKKIFTITQNTLLFQERINCGQGSNVLSFFGKLRLICLYFLIYFVFFEAHSLSLADRSISRSCLTSSPYLLFNTSVRPKKTSLVSGNMLKKYVYCHGSEYHRQSKGFFPLNILNFGWA